MMLHSSVTSTVQVLLKEFTTRKCQHTRVARTITRPVLRLSKLYHIKQIYMKLKLGLHHRCSITSAFYNSTALSPCMQGKGCVSRKIYRTMQLYRIVSFIGENILALKSTKSTPPVQPTSPDKTRDMYSHSGMTWGRCKPWPNCGVDCGLTYEPD